MPKKLSSLKECLETCSSIKHANELIAAVTLPRSKVTDKQLASYLKSKCFCFHSVQDQLNRKVLHMAASCGRTDLCLWLIKCWNAGIDYQDNESGYTPLHRAILYGHIDTAVALIQLGASLNVMDREDFTAVDLVQKNFKNYCVLPLFQPRFAVSERSVDMTSSNDNLLKLASERKDFLAASYHAFVTEVYTCGTNLNYTLGFGAESSKTDPEFLEFFEKKNEIIIDIQMHKYHTLFLSLDGNVWSCGLGHGGRLGLSSDNTVLIPQRITLASKLTSQTLFCIKAAVGADHSIFLCNDNQILTCGLNTYHQLGISPPPSAVSKPQSVEIISCKSQIMGVAASTFHSVFWTSSTVHACGFHAGQLGFPHSSDKTVSTFQKVPLLDFQYTNITNVAVSDAATVIVTDAHDVYLLHGYKIERIDIRHIITSESLDRPTLAESVQNRNDEPIQNRNDSNACAVAILKVVVWGGELDAEKAKMFSLSNKSETLQIAVLLSNGTVFLKKHNSTQFLKCDFLKKHEIKILDVHLNSCGMLLCSYKGEGFRAQVQGLVKTFGKAKDDFVKVSHRSKEEIKECYLVKLMHIPNAHRSVRIFSEPSSSNFSLLQIRSVDFMKNIPDVSSDTISPDIENFYRETSELDPFYDITFKVGKRSFVAHKYIMASCSEALLSKENGSFVVIDNIHEDIFEQLLLFIYTNTSRLLQEGPCSIKIRKADFEKHSGHNSPKGFENPLKLSVKAAEKFKVTDYVRALQCFRYENEKIIKINHQSLRKRRLCFNRFENKHLYDIKLKSQDGQIFHAHKCILAARVEYFKSMLCGTWIESSNSYHEHRMPINGLLLSDLLEFVYTDSVTRPVYKKDFNFWCSLLVAADQFILLKLKEICENSVTQCLDTRNVCDVLMFADAIHANQLKTSCYEFISINLSSLLYSKLLDKLNDELLTELTDYYRNQFRITDSLFRNPLNIPVYRNACSAEDIINAESICSVDWEAVDDPFSKKATDRKLLKTPQKKKKKTVRSSPALRVENTRSKNLKITTTERILNLNNEICVMRLESPPEEPTASQWTKVDKHLKSVRTRLKVNAAVKSCPEIIEQKENYTPLNSLKITPTSPSVDECKEDEMNDKSPRSRTYSIEIDFQNITPKLSQKQRRKLSRLNEPEKSDESNSSNKEIYVGKSVDSSLPSSSVGCWRMENDNSEAVNFSAIVASEKKNKTLVQKETRKIETKPLHLTQIEDQAIQELIAFYDVNRDEELVTVQRVIVRTAVPRWVTK